MTIEKPKLISQGQMGEEYSHPAFGQISCSRVTGGNNYLYGSDFAHHNTVRISITGSVVVRDHGIERAHNGRELIEIEMSESQWASMVSSLNMGSGTMCTLRRVAGEKMPHLPPPEDKQEIFAKSMDETLAKAKEHAKELRIMLEQSGLPKKKVDEMLRKLGQVDMNIGSNVEYVGKVFGEHMETTVSKAKTEVEAYVTGTIARAGLKALQGSNQVISMDKPKS